MHKYIISDQAYQVLGRLLIIWVIALLLLPLTHQAKLFYGFEGIGDIPLMFWVAAWGQRHSLNIVWSTLLAIFCDVLITAIFVFYGFWLGLKM